MELTSHHHIVHGTLDRFSSAQHCDLGSRATVVLEIVVKFLETMPCELIHLTAQRRPYHTMNPRYGSLAIAAVTKISYMRHDQRACVCLSVVVPGRKRKYLVN